MNIKEILKTGENANPNYLATICKIESTHPISGADRLVKTVINGYDIVTTKDTKPGDIVVYIPVESSICDEFLSKNNLYELSCYEKNTNHDEIEKLKVLLESANKEESQKISNEIKSKCGFFNKHGRVRMIKLRGQYSMGYIIPWETFINTFGLELDPEIGYKFNMVNDIEFCTKYIPFTELKPNNHVGTGSGNKANKKLKKFDKLIPGTFEFHYDTKQLGQYMDVLNPLDSVCVTTKLHGCVERNTIVNTLEYGDKTIGEIVDNKINCNIKSFNTQTNKIEYSPIEQFYYVPNDGEWYEIELEDGRKITITGNNPVWLPELKCYRRVDELVGDEKLLVNIS